MLYGCLECALKFIINVGKDLRKSFIKDVMEIEFNNAGIRMKEKKNSASNMRE